MQARRLALRGCVLVSPRDPADTRGAAQGAEGGRGVSMRTVSRQSRHVKALNRLPVVMCARWFERAGRGRGAIKADVATKWVFYSNVSPDGGQGKPANNCTQKPLHSGEVYDTAQAAQWRHVSTPVESGIVHTGFFV